MGGSKYNCFLREYCKMGFVCNSIAVTLIHLFKILVKIHMETLHIIILKQTFEPPDWPITCIMFLIVQYLPLYIKLCTLWTFQMCPESKSKNPYFRICSLQTSSRAVTNLREIGRSFAGIFGRNQRDKVWGRYILLLTIQENNVLQFGVPGSETPSGRQLLPSLHVLRLLFFIIIQNTKYLCLKVMSCSSTDFCLLGKKYSDVFAAFWLVSSCSVAVSETLTRSSFEPTFDEYPV